MDEVCPEFLMALDVVGLSWLTRFYNIAWQSGLVRLNWQTGDGGSHLDEGAIEGVLQI